MTDVQKILTEIQKLRAELKVSRRQLLTVGEVALALALAEKTVRNQLSAGTFPVRPVRSGGRVRFRQVDIDKYVESLGVE